MLETKERLPRELIAMRVAAEFRGGEFVNLGIGIPNLVAEFTPPEKGVIFHAENGLLGIGRAQEVGKVEIPDMANAGGQPVTAIPGAWIMDSAESFAIVRGGHLDIAVLGGLQVSETGDLANHMRAGRAFGSVGGAADIATGARRLFVAMEHTTKDGELKILRRCTYPLTAVGVVKKVFTDVAVISVTPDGLVLEEVAPGWTPEEVQQVTEPPLRVSPDLREIQLA
ncbi:MAG TPA: 3-oxoacid CoA-transferase subunit B, partial [Dehalococcoidia bacterium]